MTNQKRQFATSLQSWQKSVVTLLAMLLLVPFNLFSDSLPQNNISAAEASESGSPETIQTPAATVPGTNPDVNETPTATVNATAGNPSELPDSIPLGTSPAPQGSEVVVDEIAVLNNDRVKFTPVDSVAIVDEPEWVVRDIAFNPDPTRAVWMAALFPGLGQLYNRRYWKLPLVVGGYLGLGYATSWNNGMLRDYTKAYADIMDNDPSTKSYMDFFPSTVREEDLDKTWLTNVLQSRKNYFRRNRDLCIIGMVGVYLVAMVDAYVDASLAHFDISPDLSMDIYPTLIQDGRSNLPSFGLHWALAF